MEKGCGVLNDLKPVNLFLQGNSLTLADVRALFDEVIEMHPETASCMSPNYAIVRHPVFKRAVVKIKDNRFEELSGEGRISFNFY